jgi:acetyl/propionyl-CoA carboxylase alpha subunit
MREVEVAGEVFEVRLHRDAEDSYRGRVNGREVWLEARRTPAGSWLLVRDGRVVEAFVEGDGELRVHLPGLEVPVRIRDPLRNARARGADGKGAGPATVASPMPGKVVVVLAQVGDEVEEGQGLVVVEAMKMENELRSPKGGKVARVAVEAGQAVEAGAPLIVVE